MLPSLKRYFSLWPCALAAESYSECESQFRHKVPLPNKSLCLRLGGRSVRRSDWNYAITFPTNNWARQEHWCERRAHKMCISKCLPCSLGLKQREEWARQHCGSTHVCICACRRWCLFSSLPVSTGLRRRMNTESRKKINKSVQGPPEEEEESRTANGNQRNQT